MSKFPITPIEPLSTQAMENVLETFKHCVDAVARQTAHTELPTLNTWATGIMTRVAVMTLRPDSLQEIADSIFKNGTVRDFVFNVSFRFFTLCAEDADFVKRLAANFEQGLTLDPTNKEASFIPDDVLESMPRAMYAAYKGNFTAYSAAGSMTMTEFLANNKLLLIVYLFSLTQFPPETKE